MVVVIVPFFALRANEGIATAACNGREAAAIVTSAIAVLLRQETACCSSQNEWPTMAAKAKKEG